MEIEHISQAYLAEAAYQKDLGKQLLGDSVIDKQSIVYEMARSLLALLEKTKS